MGRFFWKFFAQLSMEGRVFDKFQKKPKSFKVPKLHKRVPKSIRTRFERVLAQIFRNILCPVFHGGSSFRKLSKKSKKFQNSKNAQNRSQKNPKVFWTSFGANFSKKNCYPSVPWRLESSKTFKKIKKSSKFQKCPISFPKASKRVLNVFWREYFEKNFAQCSMDGRVFKNFQTNQKNFKIPKMPKIVPKRIQKCF